MALIISFIAVLILKINKKEKEDEIKMIKPKIETVKKPFGITKQDLRVFENNMVESFACKEKSDKAKSEKVDSALSRKTGVSAFSKKPTAYN